MTMPNELGAVEAAAAIREGRLTSHALVEACLARIDAREPEVAAWQCVAREQALHEAREADRLPPRGPLHGVPIGVKDILDTFDLPTALGSPLYATRQPTWDAACVAAARAAGAIVLGKTVTTEFASYHPGPTRNPHDRSRTPGGSSSGSAAAVADSMVPLAFGTQTAASVTRPAAFCGIVGYKATFDELPLSGVRPLAQSLDTLGIFARSVADVALLCGVLHGAAPRDLVLPAAPPRFGICRTPLWRFAEAASREAFDLATQRLREAGASLAETVLPSSFERLTDAQQAIMTYETARNYVFEMTRHPNDVSASFRAICEAGMRIDRETYVAARRQVAEARAHLADALGSYDALVTPATCGEAPTFETGTGDPLMSRMWTALGTPTLSLPVPRAPGVLPVAVQLVSGLHTDSALLAAGAWAARVLSARGADASVR